MDFRRIEHILIIAFLLLNIFLGYVFVSKNSLLFMNQTDQADIDVAQEMQSDNIVYPELETESRKLPLIRAERHRELSEQMNGIDTEEQTVTMGNSERLFGRFSEPIELTDLTSDISSTDITESILAPINAILNDGTIIEGGSYEYQMYYPQERMIRYVQKTTTDAPIVDSTSEIIFLLDDNLNVVSYEQTNTGSTISQGDARHLISQASALENLYLNNRLSHNSTIIDSHLGYYTTLPLVDMIMYSPVWVFMLQTEDGGITTLYIDAITGAMIQNDGIITSQSAAASSN